MFRVRGAAILDVMTTPSDSRSAVLTGLTRLSDDVSDLSARLTRIGTDVDALTALLRTDASPTATNLATPPLIAPAQSPFAPGFQAPGPAAFQAPDPAGFQAPSPAGFQPGSGGVPIPGTAFHGSPTGAFRPNATTGFPAGPWAPGNAAPFAGQQPIGPAGHPAAGHVPMTPGPMPRYLAPQHPPAPKVPLSERLSTAFEKGLVGRILAGLGVGVTLIGVVLLLVLAAQAGLLSPGLRVAGGGVLAATLVGTGLWLSRTPESRAGAVALCATGIGAAYLDVLAAAVIYHWLPDAAGLVLCGLIGGAGVALAYRWSSETLGLLVVVPLIVLAPVITGGFTLVTACFMLALSAVGLLVQIDRDWLGLFCARMIAASFALTIALVSAKDDLRSDNATAWLYLAVGLLGFAVAVGGTLLALRRTDRGAEYALAGMLSLVPFAMASLAAQSVPAAVGTLTCAAVLVILVYAGDTLPGVTLGVRQIWLTTAAVAAYAAVGAITGGHAQSVTVLAIAIVCAVAAPNLDSTGKAVLFLGTAFAAIGALGFLRGDRLGALIVNEPLTGDRQAWEPVFAIALCAAAIAIGYGYQQLTDQDSARTMWFFCGVVSVAAVTDLCVSLGVLIDPDAGFRGGHVAATIVWMGTAATLLWYARRGHGPSRALPLTVGLVLVAAAVAKLFLFDLAALDGVFRVIVFIVTGLMILTLGSVYAKSLTDDRHQPAQ